ncbi:MAG: Abi family protein [Bacteroides sp.]|nr:Abi family protein [Bacteroides sp.]
MTLPLYSESQISVSEQIRLLKSDGLIIENEQKAINLLNHISLFRFKSYLKPYRDPKTKKFKNNASFESAYSLYQFDSALRQLIYGEIEKIEVSFRTQLSLIMSEESGVYWFEKAENFKNPDKHSELLAGLHSELKRCDDEMIVDFQRKYANVFPPSWMTFEVASFGTLSKIYRLLKSGRARRKVAKFYGLSDTVMESWLHALVYVRNICAHHSRLWNRRMSINAIIPRKTHLKFINVPKDTKRVYFILSILVYFLQSVNPQNTFPTRLKALISKFPHIDLGAMGFPIQWKDEPLWSN